MLSGTSFYPRSSIKNVSRSSNPLWNIGGVQTSLLGSWAIGGAYRNIVKLELEPKVAGRFASLFPLTARRVFLSLEEPNGFIEMVQNGHEVPAL
jgi:hypothetical protein